MKKTALDNILKVSINKLKSDGRYRYFNEMFPNLSEKKVHMHLMENAKQVLKDKYPKLEIVKLYFTLNKHIIEF